MKTKLLFLILGLGLVLTLSCTKYPPSSERLLEDLAVVTQYDTKATFSDYSTYYILPYVMEVTDKDTFELTGANVQAALDRIDYNMKQRGYTAVGKNENPDLAISLVYMESTYVYVYDPYYYYPYNWYGYGYYYPYYPVYYSSYSAGLANMQMVDLLKKVVNGDQTTIYVRWTALIRGLMTGTHTAADVQNAIDQAFVQTPQIKK